MTIIRDGIIYILTPAELRTAYEEAREQYRIQDLSERLDYLIEAENFPLISDDEERDHLLRSALPKLEKYYDDFSERGDIYWTARENALMDTARESGRLLTVYD